MRQRRHGHVRQRSPGSWEVRYTLGTEPGTGKRRTITATVKGERRDADALDQQHAADDGADAVDDGRDGLDAELLAHHQDRAENSASEKT